MNYEKLSNRSLHMGQMLFTEHSLSLTNGSSDRQPDIWRAHNQDKLSTSSFTGEGQLHAQAKFFGGQ